MADGVNQVCFSKSNPPIDKEWIVISSGLIGYSFLGGMSKLVTGADYKALKSVFADKACSSSSSMRWRVNSSVRLYVLLRLVIDNY